MASSKYLLAEEVLFRLKGGNPTAASTIKIQDIKKALENVINSMFKVEQFSVNMPNGVTIPSGTMLATYDQIVVYKYKDISAATLPAIPISLPRNMGLFHVSKAGTFDCPFIPVEAGQLALIKGEGLISDILGQVGYTPNGNIVVFNSDITNAATFNIQKVLMQLAIMDLSLYSDFDILPVPPDMEATVVEQVFNFFKEQIPTDKIDDPGVDKAATVMIKK